MIDVSTMSKNTNKTEDIDIKQHVVSGIKWLALIKGVSQTVSWIVTIFVIRLLTPDD